MEKRQEFPNTKIMVRDKVLKKGILITQGQENKKRVLGFIIWKLGGPSANIDCEKGEVRFGNLAGGQHHQRERTKREK